MFQLGAGTGRDAMRASFIGAFVPGRARQPLKCFVFARALGAPYSPAWHATPRKTLNQSFRNPIRCWLWSHVWHEGVSLGCGFWLTLCKYAC